MAWIKTVEPEAATGRVKAMYDVVIGYFNYINRMADALGVEEEAWLRPWEQIPDADDRGA